MALTADGAGLDRYGDEPLPPPNGDGRGGSLYGGGGGCLEPPFIKKKIIRNKVGKTFRKSFNIQSLFFFCGILDSHHVAGRWMRQRVSHGHS